MDSPLKRIYQLKITILALLSSGLGILLVFAAKAVAGSGPSWLQSWPISELGSTLFITGAFVVAYDYLDGKDKEARENERIRNLLIESAPAMRDAVVRGFAVQPDDLKRVATPELLDDIAANVLGLRLGDPQFASELYADIRDQAIRAPERWYDVDIKVRLSTAVERGGLATPLFDVLVEWEYTTVPSHPVQRFACVSDRDEYYELTTDIPATSTWFMTPRPGLDAGSKESFELLYFSVDGAERKIQWYPRKSGQTYSATIGEDLVRAGKPVRIKHIYRIRATPESHYLFIDIAQPSKNVNLRIDYDDAPISRLRVLDLVTSSRRPQLTELPTEIGGRNLSLEVPGWLMPKAGFTFVWTLVSEEGGEAARFAPRRAELAPNSSSRR